MKILLILTSVAVVIFLVGPDTVEGQNKNATRTIAGTISGFECGDNCYLTITDDKGKVHSGLCAARACDAWNDETVMPEGYKGKRVKVTVGRGTQYDGSGRVAGKMDAFTKIQFLPETQAISSSACTFCGIWKYTDKGNMFQGETVYLRLTQAGGGRFRLVTGFPDLAGQIEWTDYEIKNADGIYLTPVGEKLTGSFISPNFYATRWQDYSYRVTCSLSPKGSLNYSVWSSPGAKPVGPAKTERFVATRISE
jgi:hypothetical protein